MFWKQEQHLAGHPGSFSMKVTGREHDSALHQQDRRRGGEEMTSVSDRIRLSEALEAGNNILI